MKYFTPELIGRLASPDDAVASAAMAEWEEALERYDRRLREMEPDFPPQVRHLRELLLHDAVVLGLGRGEGRLVLMLRKDIPPRDLIVFTYTLVSDLDLNREALAPEDRSGMFDFLYDELDLIRDGDRVSYTQAILFGNGWELRLHFSDVQVVVAEPLYAAPGMPPTSVSLTAQAG